VTKRKKKTDEDLIRSIEVRGIFLAKQELQNKLNVLDGERRHLVERLHSDRRSLSSCKEQQTRLENAIRDAEKASERMTLEMDEIRAKIKLAEVYWKGKK